MDDGISGGAPCRRRQHFPVVSHRRRRGTELRVPRHEIRAGTVYALRWDRYGSGVSELYVSEFPDDGRCRRCERIRRDGSKYPRQELLLRRVRVTDMSDLVQQLFVDVRLGQVFGQLHALGDVRGQLQELFARGLHVPHHTTLHRPARAREQR